MSDENNYIFSGGAITQENSEGSSFFNRRAVIDVGSTINGNYKLYGGQLLSNMTIINGSFTIVGAALIMFLLQMVIKELQVVLLLIQLL